MSAASCPFKNLAQTATPKNSKAGEFGWGHKNPVSRCLGGEKPASARTLFLDGSMLDVTSAAGMAIPEHTQSQ